MEFIQEKFPDTLPKDKDMEIELQEEYKGIHILGTKDRLVAFWSEAAGVVESINYPKD